MYRSNAIGFLNTPSARGNADRRRALAPADTLCKQRDGASHAACRAFEFMRQEYEEGAASRQLSQIGQVLGRQDATPESCPVWRIVILHLAMPRASMPMCRTPRSYSKSLSAALPPDAIYDSASPPGRAGVAVGPVSAKEHDIASRKPACLRIPVLQEGSGNDRVFPQIGLFSLA